MRQTNYAEISKVYEQNRWRHGVDADPELGRALEARQGAAGVLDLGCGTGFYLGAQLSAFGKQSARWVGLDASSEMLERAKAKISDATWVHGRAEALPFSDAEFDYVNSNFSFHHFSDKERALDEVRRVLAPGAVFRMHNIAPEHMADWWVYEYFPAAGALDRERFWPIRRIFAALEARGLRTELRVEYTLTRYPHAEVVAHAERRDISNLAILDAEDYARGLERLRAETALDAEGRIVSGLAMLTAIAHAPS